MQVQCDDSFHHCSGAGLWFFDSDNFYLRINGYLVDCERAPGSSASTSCNNNTLSVEWPMNIRVVKGKGRSNTSTPYIKELKDRITTRLVRQGAILQMFFIYHSPP